MKITIENAPDFRQSPGWRKYMQAIGWKVVDLDGTAICIKPLIFGMSFIKIQHPITSPSIKKIDALAKKYHAISVVIEPHTYNFDEALYTHAGFYHSALRHAPSATRKIDITKPLPQIIGNFSDNAKRNIKKAQKNNITIKTILAKDDKNNTHFEKYFVLQKHLTDMKKFYAPGHSESMKKNMMLKNSSFFTFAYQKNNPNPIATVWYGYFDGVITYLQTGITQEGYETLANYLLVLEGIKIGKKLRCNVFDFESIFDPRYPKDGTRWKGYSVFKSRFHGQEIYYPSSFIKLYNPLFKWFYTFSKPFIP